MGVSLVSRVSPTANNFFDDQPLLRLPRLLDALGHPDDEAVEDLLQVLMPLASPVQTVKKEES